MSANYYLCCGNKTGVSNPGEWVGIDIQGPCEVLADVRTIQHLPDAERIFATPPCDSFTDLPWRPATNKDVDILRACLRLCKESPEWLLENNKWAQKFIGKADFHRGPHYFWGNILVPDFIRSRNKSAMDGHNPLARAALPVIWNEAQAAPEPSSASEGA